MTMMMRIVMLCCITALPLALGGCSGDQKWVEEHPPIITMPRDRGSRVDDISPEAVEEWFQGLPLYGRPKLTKLHFYVHDNVTADNPTAVLVAPANSTNQASTVFGATYVMDDPITVSHDPSSQIIGRAQGTFTFVSQTDTVLFMAITMVFTEGNYNGSTLSILGNNPISHKYREMPILGGSGVFRLARGTATINTVTVDIAKLNDILEYHIIIQQY